MLPLNTKPGMKVWHLRHDYQIEEVELESYLGHSCWEIKRSEGTKFVPSYNLFKTKQAAVNKAKTWLKELSLEVETKLARLQEYKANLEKSQS